MFKSKMLNEVTSNLNNNMAQIPSLLMENVESEPVIQINSDLRTIIIPDELKNIAVTGDHLSETIYFSCPRYFDGIDLSEHTCIIRFINAGNEYGESDIVDLEIDDTKIKFGWALDNHVTRYSGRIQFTVQFESYEDTIEYQWQTTPAELVILPGLNIEETITDQDDLLFRSLASRITDLENKMSDLSSISQRISTISTELQQLKTDVDYLKENVVYTLSEL